MSSIEQLRSRLGLGPSQQPGESEVRVLTAADVRHLRLPWLSRFGPPTLTDHITRYPGMALWVPQSNEYVVSEPWRTRFDIANIIEVTARASRAALVGSLLDRLRDGGYRLALVASEVWQEQTRFYAEMGFERVESIVFFELPLKRGTPPTVPAWASPLPELEYVRVEQASLDTLLSVDHRSFPWLWWNSRAEMEGYLRIPGVYAYLAYKDGAPVGYASFTIYRGWAHLDRLAVVTDQQGRKYGAAQLVHALRHMVSHDVTSVALSTQVTNVQSHRLYTGFGFRQTNQKMHFHGKQLQTVVEN